MSDFAVKRTCDECPWRRDVAVGRFTPERYKAIDETCNRSSDRGPFQPIFACHKTKEGRERACAGFVLVVGYDNIAVRIASSYGRLEMAEITAAAPLYDSFAEMARANGWEPESTL